MNIKKYYGILNCDLEEFLTNYKKGTIFEFAINKKRIVHQVCIIKDIHTRINIAYQMHWNWENFDMIDESKRLYRLIMDI